MSSMENVNHFISGLNVLRGICSYQWAGIVPDIIYHLPFIPPFHSVLQCSKVPPGEL